MRSVSDKIFIEYQHTHFIFNNPFFSKIVPIMRLCEKNITDPGRPQMTV